LLSLSPNAVGGAVAVTAEDAMAAAEVVIGIVVGVTGTADMDQVDLLEALLVVSQRASLKASLIASLIGEPLTLIPFTLYNKIMKSIIILAITSLALALPQRGGRGGGGNRGGRDGGRGGRDWDRGGRDWDRGYGPGGLIGGIAGGIAAGITDNVLGGWWYRRNVDGTFQVAQGDKPAEGDWQAVPAPQVAQAPQTEAAPQTGAAPQEAPEAVPAPSA